LELVSELCLPENDTPKGQRVMEHADLQRVRSGSAEAFAFATLLVVIATLVRWTLGFLTEGVLHFAAYYPPRALSP
jgi:hypothetical protein